MLRSRLIQAMLGFAFSCLFLVGCAGKFPGDRGTGSSAFALNSNVKQLDSAAITVEAVAADSVTLKGAVPVLKAGDVIVRNGTDEKRFLRKVVSVAVNGDETTVTTSEATADDVFKTASIKKTEDFTAALYGKLVSDSPQVTIGPFLKGKGRDGGSGIAINFEAFEIRSGDMLLGTISGTLWATAGVETRLEKDFGITVKEFRVAPYFRFEGSATVKSNLNASWSHEFTIAHAPSIPIGALGPLGINTNVELRVRVDGSFRASGNFKINGHVYGKAGVQFVNGGWGTVSEFDAGLTAKPPKLRAEASLSLSVIRPQLGLDVLGIGEAHVTADTLRTALSFFAIANPNGYKIQLKNRWTISAGGSLKLGPFTIWQGNLPDFDLGEALLPGGDITLLDIDPALESIVYLLTQPTRLLVKHPDGLGVQEFYTGVNTTLHTPEVNSNGWVCFGANGSLNKVHINGGGFQELLPSSTVSINHPSWSPDQTMITFDAMHAATGKKQIYVYKLSTGQFWNLTDSANGNSRKPRFSPDGAYIVYEFDNFLKKNIMRVRVSDGAIDVLHDMLVSVTDPCISPDGELMVFTDTAGQLWISNADGTSPRVIRTDHYYKRPFFSPDSTMVVVQYGNGLFDYMAKMDIAGDFYEDLGDGFYPSWARTN